MAEDLATQSEQSRSLQIRMVLAGLATAALLVFVFQNTQDAPVKFLWLEGSPPLFLLLLITVGLTLIVATLVTWILRRRG